MRPTLDPPAATYQDLATMKRLPAQLMVPPAAGSSVFDVPPGPSVSPFDELSVFSVPSDGLWRASEMVRARITELLNQRGLIVNTATRLYLTSTHHIRNLV